MSHARYLRPLRYDFLVVCLIYSKQLALEAFVKNVAIYFPVLCDKGNNWHLVGTLNQPQICPSWCFFSVGAGFNYWPSLVYCFFKISFFALDGLIYWQEKQDSHKPNDNPWLRPYYRPRSADIEITAYALLAYSREKDISVGLSIARWLSQQRNSLGGYSSTQVDLIAWYHFTDLMPTFPECRLHFVRI